MYKKYDWIKLTDFVGKHHPGAVGMVVADQVEPLSDIEVLFMLDNQPVLVYSDFLLPLESPILSGAPALAPTEELDRYVLGGQSSVMIETDGYAIQITTSDEGVTVIGFEMDGDWIDQSTIVGMFEL